MWAFLIKRLAGGLLTLFVIATLCFAIIRFAPGSPFSSERKIPPEVLANIERKYGFDKDLHVQYGLRLRGYLSGDLGYSIKYERSVNELLFPSLRYSLMLGAIAFILAVTFGVALGIIAAARHNRIPDYLSMSVALTGICVPNFLLGPLLVMVFSLALSWLPVAGWPDGWSWGELSKIILPAIALSMVHIAYISRLTRAGMLDVLNKDFIRTARAKGLSEKVVFLKHVLKNGITPVVSYAGPMAAYILTGSVVVERIFNINGMGRHFVDSSLARDYDVVMGALLIYSTLVIGFNLVVDMAYSFLDPRVRLT